MNILSNIPEEVKIPLELVKRELINFVIALLEIEQYELDNWFQNLE